MRLAVFAADNKRVKKLSVFLSFIVLCVSPLFAEIFSYKQALGNKWRIISTVQEDVIINGQFSHHSEIVERIASEITGMTNSEALIKAVFQSAEKAVNPDGSERFAWGEDYAASFMRTSQGHIQIQSSYFRPATHNVPTFPATNVREGQTWQAPGTEVHDLRESLGLAAPYRIPFTADYKYLGHREWQGKRYPAFSISWDIDYTPPKSATRRPGENPPAQILEQARQILYWDSAAGHEVAAEEEFTLVFLLADNTRIEFRAKGVAEIVESERMDREETVREIAEEVERLDIPGATVKETPEGIMLSLDSIQFEPDSNRFLPGEDAKLAKIAELLSRFNKRDLLIGGHTAMAGTKAVRDRLSLERAEAVASFLISRDVRSPAHIVTRGYGADRPIAPNTSEAGRQQNRRVEITILEN
ncbi:MAG: OmpA family protein [Spirochaetaceae bacterium]|nr:OmpA family protein [Spirochaetaceae bacterium]